MPKDLLKTASQFDVHRWSDYPEVKRVADSIFDEIKTLRQEWGERIREADKLTGYCGQPQIDPCADI